MVETNSDADLAKNVNIGPVAITVNAMATPWRFYSSGVIRADCPPATNHGVLAVGLIDGDHYLIKNSWGEGWGDQGYVRIGREEGVGLCGINLVDSRAVIA